MVLSDDLTVLPDIVVDVNPRLTTSYIGLRRAATSNLAEAMLDVGRGLTRPLFFQPGRVKFDCNGVVG